MLKHNCQNFHYSKLPPLGAVGHAIRAVYTQDIAEKMGYLRPDERERLQAALKAVDDEEVCMARLFAAGKITDTVWDGLWREWQDRRNQIRSTLASLQYQHETHITNLDAALQMIVYVGIVYNSLDCSDQKELLRHTVSRVMIDHEGTISLELRSPFSYLQDITKQIRNRGTAKEDQAYSKKKTGEDDFTSFPRTESSLTALYCGSDGIRTHSGHAILLQQENYTPAIYRLLYRLKN